MMMIAAQCIKKVKLNSKVCMCERTILVYMSNKCVKFPFTVQSVCVWNNRYQ